jgi:hypothetical protein
MAAKNVWYPKISQKQMDLLRLCRRRDGRRKVILVSGPRFASKTIACLHACVDHAWNVRNAVVCLLVPTITAGTDSGVWTLLTERIIPEWIEAGFGLDWAPNGTPRQHGVTKKFYCLITNKYGGTSRFEVNSLKDERDVENDFKNRYFSMVYWSELSNYKRRHTFSTLLQSVRVPGLPEDDHIMLCDTNPADEGTESWIYKLWYQKENEPEEFRKTLHLMEFTLDDNPFLTPARKAEIMESFKYDPVLYARMALGKWVAVSTDSLFGDVFRPTLHVVGYGEPQHPQFDKTVLIPEKNTDRILVGWDFGWTNPAAVFVEPFYPDPNDPDRASFKCFDEIVMTKTQISVREFTRLVLERMQWWEDVCKRKFNWQHWSDRSAFSQFEPIAERFQCDEVLACSGGKIALLNAEQGPGSVASRIRLIRALLNQNRLFFSAHKTPELIKAIRNLRPGKTPYSFSGPSVHRHPFDAMSYPIWRECMLEVQADAMAVLKSASKEVAYTPVPL